MLAALNLLRELSQAMPSPSTSRALGPERALQVLQSSDRKLQRVAQETRATDLRILQLALCEDCRAVDAKPAATSIGRLKL
jgi:hypothetical protein